MLDICLILLLHYFFFFLSFFTGSFSKTYELFQSLQDPALSPLHLRPTPPEWSHPVPLFPTQPMYQESISAAWTAPLSSVFFYPAPPWPSSCGCPMGILHRAWPRLIYWCLYSLLLINPLTDATPSQNYESFGLCFTFMSSPPKCIPNPTTAYILHSYTLVPSTGISPQDQCNHLWITALSTKYF